MRTKIGVLVLMLDKGKNFQTTSRSLDVLKNTSEYEIIFGDRLTHRNARTYLQDQPIDILFDRYPYQKHASQDPLQNRNFLGMQEVYVPICNPRDFTELCKDKWSFQKYMQKNGVYMPPIAQNRFQYWIERWGGIAIAKPRFGSFGVGIELTKFSPSSFRKGVNGMEPTIIQQYIRPPSGYAGIAVRQLIQRNIDRSWTCRTIVARVSLDDPVVNAARGAHINRALDILPVACCEQIKSMSEKIAQILGKTNPFIIEVGLDYVIDENFSPIFIEANAQPKGKLKGLVKNLGTPAIICEHKDILEHPFRVMSKWTLTK